MKPSAIFLLAVLLVAFAPAFAEGQGNARLFIPGTTDPPRISDTATARYAYLLSRRSYTEGTTPLRVGGDVLVQVWHADWCGHCRDYEPIVRKLMAAGLPVQWIDVDTEWGKKASKDRGIMRIPATVFYLDGKEAERMVGVQTYETVSGVIERLRNEGAASSAVREARIDAAFAPQTIRYPKPRGLFHAGR